MKELLKKFKKKKKIIYFVLAVIIVGIVVYFMYTSIEWDFKIHTDEKYRTYQNFWSYGEEMMAVEDGYYYIKSDNNNFNKVYHIDKDGKSAEIICKRENCMHNDSTKCYAIWAGNFYGQLQYNNGYLFYVALSADGYNYYLYGGQPDGTRRHATIDLGYSRYRAINDVVVHDNHIFMIEAARDGSSYSFKDYNLKAHRIPGYKKTVYESNDGSSIRILDITNGKVLYGVEQNDKVSLYEYDIDKKDNNKIKDCQGSLYDARYVDNFIVYTSDEGCKMFELSAPETEKNLTSNSGEHLSYCDEKIYVNYMSILDDKADDKSKNEIQVFDKTGKLIDTIPMPEDPQMDALECCFGDESFLFAASKVSDRFYVYDKSAIGTKDGSWRKLECK